MKSETRSRKQTAASAAAILSNYSRPSHRHDLRSWYASRQPADAFNPIAAAREKYMRFRLATRLNPASRPIPPCSIRKKPLKPTDTPVKHTGRKLSVSGLAQNVLEWRTSCDREGQERLHDWAEQCYQAWRPLTRYEKVLTTHGESHSA